MFESQLKQYALQLNSIQRLCNDLTDDDLSREVIKTLSPGKWILGHLVLCADFCLGLAEQPITLDQTYHELYMPGSTPEYNDSRYLSKQDYLDELSRSHEHVTSVLSQIDPEVVAQPQETPFFQEALPLRQDLISHLLTSHEMFHTGQLSTLRRALGFPPLF